MGGSVEETSTGSVKERREERTVFRDGLAGPRGPEVSVNERERAKEGKTGTDGGASGEQVEPVTGFGKLEFRVRSTARGREGR